jgi:multisubunit Na+/H+ antiporter MnhC subunit
MGATGLTCLKYLSVKPIINEYSLKETMMPIESALITLAVVVVFTSFALVLAWAEHQTRIL